MKKIKLIFILIISAIFLYSLIIIATTAADCSKYSVSGSIRTQESLQLGKTSDQINTIKANLEKSRNNQYNIAVNRVKSNCNKREGCKFKTYIESIPCKMSVYNLNCQLVGIYKPGNEWKETTDQSKKYAGKRGSYTIYNSKIKCPAVTFECKCISNDDTSSVSCPTETIV